MGMVKQVYATLAAIWVGAAALAQAPAPEVKPIDVVPGGSSAIGFGMLTGDQTVDYTFQAEAGQRLSVNMWVDNSSTYFNVLPPGSDSSAIFIGSIGGNAFLGKLPQSGEYKVRVYLMRNAARRGDTATYRVMIGLTDIIDADDPVPADMADVTPDGPATWVVSVNSTLNMRAAPTTGAEVVLKLNDGAVVRNLGCQLQGAREWCNVALKDGSTEGWVVREFLEPSEAPASTDAAVQGTTFNATGRIRCAQGDSANMGLCDFGVRRAGDGTGEMVVTLPDGSDKTIAFVNFMPQAGPGGSVRQDSDLFVFNDGDVRLEIPLAVTTGR
ncbi:MAG: SH3 domain-containing protein [Pseudomonadota bacterium]